jgi:hypothetical protein
LKRYKKVDVAIRALASLQIGHAGYQVGDPPTDLGDFPVRIPSNVKWSHHDQTSRISYLNVGGSASVGLTKSWSVFLALFTTVWGRNGHALSLGEVVGLSWSFRTPWARQQAAIYPIEEGDSPNRDKVLPMFIDGPPLSSLHSGGKLCGFCAHQDWRMEPSVQGLDGTEMTLLARSRDRRCGQGAVVKKEGVVTPL